MNTPLFPTLSNARPVLRHITQHLQNTHVKTCKHYYTAIFPYHTFYSAINTKLYNLLDSAWLGYFYLIIFTGKTNRSIKPARTPYPKQSVFGMVLNFWCQLFRKLMYWGRSANYKQENMIIEMMSTNWCPLYGTILYINIIYRPHHPRWGSCPSPLEVDAAQVGGEASGRRPRSGLPGADLLPPGHHLSPPRPGPHHRGGKKGLVTVC